MEQKAYFFRYISKESKWDRGKERERASEQRILWILGDVFSVKVEIRRQKYNWCKWI